MNKANICTFNDRVALVTGAGGNIGSATVARLVAHGVRVAAVDITAELVDARLRNFNIDKAMYKGYGVDVVNRDGVFKLVDEVIGRQRFEEMPYAEWKRLLDIDIDGVFHFCQAILPHMIERGYGRIVNLTSIAGECGLPGYADYSTAKAGIITLTKTLAMENAKKGITVNCVSPGMVAVGEPVPEPGTWIGRKGGADEMARGIVFLAADESSFITGVDLPVEGGRALGPHNCDM